MPLMYKKRNGVAVPASCIERNPAIVDVWQMRLTSSKSYILDFVGVIATVLSAPVRKHPLDSLGLLRWRLAISNLF